jgi:hypothetical protein
MKSHCFKVETTQEDGWLHHEFYIVALDNGELAREVLQEHLVGPTWRVLDDHEFAEGVARFLEMTPGEIRQVRART